MEMRISKSYGTHTVFDDFRLEISKGEIICILGASGVGKTTLLNILARQITFDGELLDVPQDVGYAYQETRLLPNLTVENNLRYVGATDEEIEYLLQATGLLQVKDKRPSMLSGGEKQRVALCRAVVGGKDLLLLDEAFSSLDIPLKRQLFDVFIQLWKGYKPTAVIVTHDIEEAWALGHRILVLKDGAIVLDITPDGVDLPRAYGDGVEIKQAIMQALMGDNVCH